MPETVYTRTYRVFDLDLPDGTRSVVPASRVRGVDTSTPFESGQRSSTQHTRRRRGTQRLRTVPSQRGMPLLVRPGRRLRPLPVQPAALDRAIKSQSTDGAFVARDVLTRVLRPVLHRDQAEIERWPLPERRLSPMTSGPVRATARQHRGTSNCGRPETRRLSERRNRLVRFWGSGTGAENLAPTIHDAFGVTPINGLTDRRRQRPSSSTPTSHSDSQPRRWRSQSLRNRRSSRPSMAGSQPATSCKADLNDLRNIVYQAVTATRVRRRLRRRQSLEQRQEGARTGVRGEVGRVRAKQDSLALSVPMDRDNDDDMRALRALAWAKQDQSGQTCRTASVYSDSPTGKSTMEATGRRAACCRGAETDDTELVRLSQTLLASARALGIADAFKSDTPSRVQALFAPIPAGQTDPDARPTSWSSGGSGSARLGLGREPTPTATAPSRLLHPGCRQASGRRRAELLRAVRDANADAPWPDATPDLLTSTDRRGRYWSANLDRVARRSFEPGSGRQRSRRRGGRRRRGTEHPDRRADQCRRAARLDRSRDSRSRRQGRQARRPEGGRVNPERAGSLGSNSRPTSVSACSPADWDEPVGRIRAWLGWPRQQCAALEASLQAGPASDAQREYDEARQELIDEPGVAGSYGHRDHRTGGSRMSLLSSGDQPAHRCRRGRRRRQDQDPDRASSRTLVGRLECPRQGSSPTSSRRLSELATIDVALDRRLASRMRPRSSQRSARWRRHYRGCRSTRLWTLPKSQVKTAENFTKKLALFVEAHWLPFRDQDLPAINEELVEALAAGGVDVEDVRNKLISAQGDALGHPVPEHPARRRRRQVQRGRRTIYALAARRSAPWSTPTWLRAS